MTEQAGSAIRGTDGCAPAARELGIVPAVPAGAVRLRVVSDTICPWCYVGKRRLEGALQVLAREGTHFTIEWLPYELNPDMPPGGMDRRAYRSAKFGSWERSAALDAQVAAEGAREGIEFRHERMLRTPNTRASHRLIWLAGEVGGADAQSAVVEGLFAAYFTRGQDVGDPEVLFRIGVDAGLPAGRVRALATGRNGLAEVLECQAWALSSRVQGVPSVMDGDRLLFSGAQPTSAMVDALRRIARAGRAPRTEGGAHARHV